MTVPQPRTRGKPLSLKDLGSLLIAPRENSHQGEPWGVSTRGCQKGLIGFGYFEGGSKKRSLSLDWLLVGSRDNPVSGYLNHLV